MIRRLLALLRHVTTGSYAAYVHGDGVHEGLTGEEGK